MPGEKTPQMFCTLEMYITLLLAYIKLANCIFQSNFYKNNCSG